LHKQFRSKKVRIVALSTEDPDASNVLVRRWIRTYAVPYRVGWAPDEFALTLFREGITPQTLIISRSGRIVRRFIGYSTAKTAAQLKVAIKEALNEKLIAHQ